MNILGFCLNFVDCESFLESNSPDTLALCETNLDDSIDSGNLFVRGYLPLIQKDFRTHMHSLAVYVKEGCPFAQDVSLENSAHSYLFFFCLFLLQRLQVSPKIWDCPEFNYAVPKSRFLKFCPKFPKFH